MVDNTTSVLDDYDDGEFEASNGLLVFAGFVIIFMILLAVVGNILTILSFIRDKHLRTTYNIYLVNLSIADLMIAVISMTIYLTYTLRRNIWLYGYHFCKIYSVLDYLACFVTVILMNVISYDRLMLLKLGASYYTKQSAKTACVKIAVSWLLAFLLYGPAIIGWDLWTGVNTVDEMDCDVQFAHNKVYTTTTAVMEFFIPLISLGVLNFMVILEIRSLRHNRVHTIQVASIQTQTSTANPNEKPSKNGKLNVKTKKAQKAARSLAVLVIAFAITWAPYTILTVVISFCEDCVSIPVYETFTWILWFKAALNPFLYAWSSERFRENFLYFLCCGRKINLR